MKKIFSTLLLTAAVLFTMTACLEEETSAIDVTGTATIKGNVFLNNDVTADADGLERASGATVRISYDAGKLSISGDGDSRMVILETTTDAQGVYSIEVPTSPNASNTINALKFTITVDDYETTYTEYDPFEDENVTYDAVFASGEEEVKELKIGETRIEDITLFEKEIYR